MRRIAFSLLFPLLAPLLLTGGVTVMWNPSDPTVGPFPSDFLTAPDPTQKNGLRVNLPLPDCTTAPSDCADIQLLNQLDGFQTAPRVHFTFSGPIDVASVYHAIYYVALDNLTDTSHGSPSLRLPHSPHRPVCWGQGASPTWPPQHARPRRVKRILHRMIPF